MNAHSRPTAETRWVETREGYWTVIVDGDEKDTRSISQDGTRFIAWIGYQASHWCFAKALQACVDDIKFRRARHAESVRAHQDAVASLRRMTTDQQASLIAKLEDEKFLLDYADAHVDVCGRKAEIDRKIVRLREIGSAA